MKAFLNRLQKAEQPSIPFSETSSSSTNQAPAEPIVSAPPEPFEGIRKIHPNQDELLSSTQEMANRPSSPRRGSANELGMRIPPALARVANRKVTPTGVDETIRESSESQRPEELDQLAVTSRPDPSPSRKPNLSLFSAVPFSGAAGWSTFGRSQRDKQSPLPLTEDRLANTRAGANVSRTSSQSRTTTTATRTPPTKSSILSRSNSAKLSRNNSTKQPASSSIEQASYSRVPLAPTHDIHENNSLRMAEGEISSSRSHHHHSQQENTPSSPSIRPLSVFNNTHPHEYTIDGTYPPRTAVTKQDESVTPSSLPFTFGRQPPVRPLAENLFISEFGASDDRRASAILASQAAVPGGTQWPSMVTEEMLRLSLAPQTDTPSHPSEPFPLAVTPTLEVMSSSTHAHPRAHLGSDTSTEPYGGASDDARNTVPSLISDRSHTGPSSSQGSRFTMDLPLRNVASFGSSGDELTSPCVGSSWTNPSDSDSRFEPGPRVRQMSDGRRRTRTGSSSSVGIKGLLRRTSSEKPMYGLYEKTHGLPAIGTIDPITVFPATVTNSQEFPKQDSQPANVDATATATASTSRNPDQPTPSSPRTPNLSVTPAVEVTAPTPRPSPARSRSRSNRLTDLFTRENLRIPDGHAHPSGLGVVGVEPHSRRQSLKVMGKRKAGESEEENEIVVNDERGHRPRFDSAAPSSYHRKRMKLSDASEKDAVALRVSRAASRSGEPSTQSFESSRPATAAGGARRPLSRNASAVSIPVSAIVSPRPPSVHRSISGASRRSDGLRYHDPLRNRNTRNRSRRKSESWADSWILDREEMPVQAWLFLAGFVFPLCWWAACVLPIKRGGAANKGKGSEAGHDAPDRSGSGLWVDQAQYDEELSRLWRTRCFIAAIVSTVVYVPIVACAVVFSKR